MTPLLPDERCSQWSFATTSDGGALTHNAIIDAAGLDSASRLAIAQRLFAIFLVTKLGPKELPEACESLAELFRSRLADPSIYGHSTANPSKVRKLNRVVKSPPIAVVYQE